MDRENILRFTNSIVLLSKLLTKIEDKFLRRKLYEKIFDMVSVFVINKNNSSPASHNQNLLNSINNLLDYLEYLAHISEDNVVPLLFTQRSLLKFKLHILKRNKDLTAQSGKKASGTSDVASTSDVVNLPSKIPVMANVKISKPSARTKFTRLALKSNSNKERIFHFVRKMPNVRTKDVLSEFSALSGRTVKRSLKELTDNGFLMKRSDGVAVYYFVTE